MAGVARDTSRQRHEWEEHQPDRKWLGTQDGGSVRKWRWWQMEAMWDTATWSLAWRTVCGEEGFRGIWWQSLGSWEERHMDPRGKYCMHASPAAEASEDLMEAPRVLQELQEKQSDAWVEMGLATAWKGPLGREMMVPLWAVTPYT